MFCFRVLEKTLTRLWWSCCFAIEEEEDDKSSPKLPFHDKTNILITSTCVLTGDVCARYCRLRGYNALYFSRTATESKALGENCVPKNISDRYRAIHKQVFDIRLYKFGRTLTPEQTQACLAIFNKSIHTLFFLQHCITVFVSATSFEWKDLQAKLNTKLLSKLGNFVNRVLSFIAEPQGYDSVIPDIAPGAEFHLPTMSMAKKVGKLVEEYVEAMEEVNLEQGMNTAVRIASEGNIYLQAKSAAGLVHLLAQLLEPFMPSFSREVFKQLNLSPHFSLECKGKSGGSLADRHGRNAVASRRSKKRQAARIHRYAGEPARLVEQIRREAMAMACSS
ncbi:unnamed protein product [Arabis nemorensis]|uniref:Methionyl/Leucyl tRNA synthetase domain-containing protein n=1 Tax=Arabis nemorensis TaxID=586526 RepID=A0A565AQD8_9BRAS|nr:unnamed protein product [Arabis nemorensis]